MPSQRAAEPSIRLHALVPCAGVGLRAQAGMPKQYVSVAGKAMVTHALQALLAVKRLSSVLVVLAPDDAHYARKVDAATRRRVRHAHVGGASRALSVRQGLRVLVEHGAHRRDWVLVHDAARCMVEPWMIDALIDACLDDAVGGLLAMPVADTLKQSHAERAQTTLDRRQKWLAQTPQMFRLGTLQRALSRGADGITDEASAIERLGLRPRLVAGHPMNLKVTWPQEFSLAERWIQAR